jgi:hypothetical protein
LVDRYWIRGQEFKSNLSEFGFASCSKGPRHKGVDLVLRERVQEGGVRLHTQGAKLLQHLSDVLATAVKEKQCQIKGFGDFHQLSLGHGLV